MSTQKSRVFDTHLDEVYNSIKYSSGGIYQPIDELLEIMINVEKSR